MKPTLFTREYEVSSFLVNPQKKLGLYSLLNLLQDTAWAHGQLLGFTHQSLLERKMFWVLTRQRLRMESWPDWSDVVRITTWVRPIQGPFVIRDFEIHLGDRKIGACTTSWLILQSETRKPLQFDATTLGIEVRTDAALPFDTEKVAATTGLEELAHFQVRNSDLDLNEHVNNTKYAQWILDSIPLDWHRQFQLHEYEICFLVETRAGDTIRILKTPGLSLEPMARAQFQGWRDSDQKTVFTARVHVSPA